MESHDFDLGPDTWPSQAPPGDFADRCVSAMLEEPAPKSHRRWPGKGTSFFLVAALCGSSAWATGKARASSPPVEVVRFVPAMPMPTPEPPPEMNRRIVELTPATPEPEEAEAPPPAPPVRRARPPEPEAEEPAAPAPPPFVMFPRCACDQDGVVCTCY